MQYVTPDLCDAYPELVQVVEPIFSYFGGRDSFGGKPICLAPTRDQNQREHKAEGDGRKACEQNCGQ